MTLELMTLARYLVINQMKGALFEKLLEPPARDGQAQSSAGAPRALPDARGGQ